MKHKDSRTRKISYYSRGIDDLYYEDERTRPTQKQRRFFKQLIGKCKQHEIDFTLNKHLATRADYAEAIDRLLTRLEDAGVQVKRSEEEFDRLLIVEDDPEIGRYVKERLVPHSDRRMRPGVDYGMKAAERALRR